MALVLSIPYGEIPAGIPKAAGRDERVQCGVDPTCGGKKETAKEQTPLCESKSDGVVPET